MGGNSAVPITQEYSVVGFIPKKKNGGASRGSEEGGTYCAHLRYQILHGFRHPTPSGPAIRIRGGCQPDDGVTAAEGVEGLRHDRSH